MITGATGFVGFYCVCVLIYMNDRLKLDNEIILHGRNLSKLKEMYGGILKRKDVKIYISDIVSEQLFIGDTIDYVIHAAMPSDSLSSIDPASILDIAINGTINIANLSLNKKVKSFVYLSSITIYGDIAGNNRVDEDYFDKQDWRSDKDAYMIGKRGAELVLLSKYRNKGLPVKVIRPSYIYGANPLMDSRVYNSFITSAAKEEKIVLKSDGTLDRPLVYVLDVVEAIFLALDSNSNGEAFNISGDNISLRRFYEVIAKRGNNNNSFGNESNTKVCSVNIQKSQLLLGMNYEGTHEKTIMEAIRIKRSMLAHKK